MALSVMCDKGHSYIAADIYRDWPAGYPKCPECAKDWTVARATGLAEVCPCEEWKENGPKIDAVFVIAALHGMKYTGEHFQFCPYCGKPREVAEEKDSPKEEVRSLQAREMTRNYHLWYRRTCIRCGKPFMFQSHADGSWCRSCIECGHTEHGTGFDDGQGCPCCGDVVVDTVMELGQKKISCPECGYWVNEYADVEEAAPDSKEACCGAGDARCCV